MKISYMVKIMKVKITLKGVYEEQLRIIYMPCSYAFIKYFTHLTSVH